MALADFVEQVDGRPKTLTLLNPADPAPVRGMLRDLFDDQPVTVREAEDATARENLVLLDAGGGQLAASTFDDLRDELLLVNSDLYITGARSLDKVDTPPVLARLDELPFSVRGYPDAKGKLLLVEMSRFIEARAADVGTGTLYTGFQALSRIDDERGTRRVYERLAGTDLAVHIHGVPDHDPDLDLAGHGHDCEELRTTWFVVYDHPGGERSAAMIAVLTGDDEWRGVWTYREPLVDDAAAYLADAY